MAIQLVAEVPSSLCIIFLRKFTDNDNIAAPRLIERLFDLKLGGRLESADMGGIIVKIFIGFGPTFNRQVHHTV